MTIEFLDGDGAESAPDRPPGGRQARRLPVLVAAVLLAGALVAWVLTRPSDRVPHAAPSSPTVTSVPSLDTSFTAAPPPGNRDPTACGGSPFCAVSVSVPPDVAAAVADHLPGWRTAAVRSQVRQSLSSGGTYLADRAVVLERGRRLLVLEVRRAGLPATPLFGLPPGVRTLLAHPVAGFTVEVDAALGAPPAAGRLRALGADARLVSL